MTIDRDIIAYYLNTQFSALAAAVGQDADPALGYEPDIDAALRKLGKTESELATVAVEDGQRDAYFALAEYAAARRFWHQLGDRVNTSTGKTSYNFEGQRKQAKEMMDEAAGKCASLGIDVGGGWTVGGLNLDWLEPETVT